MPNKNEKLHEANRNKNDEFYTQLSDIEKELGHYKKYFDGKVVFCNCDDPQDSNFWKYFSLNFEFLGLKKLVSTHFEANEPSYKLEIMRDVDGNGRINQLDTIKTHLKQNGDFRSPECIELLKEADIVVTNPPFSLFREYLAQLVEYNKKCILIGNKNSITYKEIFKLISNNELWIGNRPMSGGMWFIVPDNYEYDKIDGGNKLKNVSACWFTNIDISKRHEDLILYKNYYGNEHEYPKYDNYNAVNVDKVQDIPMDYVGAMGVPITFMDKYNPDQFDIIDGIGRYSMLTGPTEKTKGTYLTKINGEPKYARIVIKNKKVS